MIAIASCYRLDEDIDTPPNVRILRFDIGNTGQKPEPEMSGDFWRELLFIQQDKDDNTLVLTNINRNEGEDPNQNRLGGVSIRLLDLGWEVCFHLENGLHIISHLASKLAVDASCGLIQSSVPGGWWREYALRTAFGELNGGIPSPKLFQEWATAKIGG